MARSGFSFRCLLALTILSEACSPIGEPEPSPRETKAAEAHNMQLVGVHHLDGRSAYQPVLKEYGGRWTLFAGHHPGESMNSLNGEVERNGVSILDVSDPTAPVLLHHLPPTGEAASGAQHVQVCRGGELPNADANRVYLLRTNGQVSHEIWDVSDPSAPGFITTVVTTAGSGASQGNTHKNWWDCETGIAYLVSSAPAWKARRVLRAFDLRNPEEPKLIRDFALDGMQVGGSHSAGVTSPHQVHQATVVGNRIYLAYGPSSHGVTQILDKDKFLQGDPRVEEPFAPTTRSLLYPEVARWDMPAYWGAHTAKPINGLQLQDHAGSLSTRDFLVVVSEEQSQQCAGREHAVLFLDITEEERPKQVASFQVPQSPSGFCDQGGRFGPHSVQDSSNPSFQKSVVLVAYFNAGVRAVDIRDPFQPAEVAYFIPRVNENTMPSCASPLFLPDCDVVIQTNNVEVDDRGYIYTLDRAGTGLHVVELTGEARDIVGLPASEHTP